MCAGDPQPVSLTFIQCVHQAIISSASYSGCQFAGGGAALPNLRFLLPLSDSHSAKPPPPARMTSEGQGGVALWPVHGSTHSAGVTSEVGLYILKMTPKGHSLIGVIKTYIKYKLHIILYYI